MQLSGKIEARAIKQTHCKGKPQALNLSLSYEDSFIEKLFSKAQALTFRRIWNVTLQLEPKICGFSPNKGNMEGSGISSGRIWNKTSTTQAPKLKLSTALNNLQIQTSYPHFRH